MLHDCRYNKIKLLHELSSILWFLEKHALSDVQKDNRLSTSERESCKKIFTELKHDLERHVNTLDKNLCV